jgi:hypothetical protein
MINESPIIKLNGDNRHFIITRRTAEYIQKFMVQGKIHKAELEPSLPSNASRYLYLLRSRTVKDLILNDHDGNYWLNPKYLPIEISFEKYDAVAHSAISIPCKRPGCKRRFERRKKYSGRDQLYCCPRCRVVDRDRRVLNQRISDGEIPPSYRSFVVMKHVPKPRIKAEVIIEPTMMPNRSDRIVNHSSLMRLQGNRLADVLNNIIKGEAILVGW